MVDKWKVIDKKDFRTMLDKAEETPTDFFDSKWRNDSFCVTDEHLIIRTATDDDLTEQIETAKLHTTSVKKQE